MTDDVAGVPYPLVLTKLTGVRCVVVGGGAVAERKVMGLLDSGAAVEVVSPTVSGQLAQLVADGRIRHTARTVRDDDLIGALLVIAATDDPAVNAAVARTASASGQLVNVADDPQAGNFHTVATVRRGDLLVTISTGGASPALAALVRRRIEDVLGPEYTELTALLGRLRAGIVGRLPAAARRRVWHRLASEQVLGWFRAGEQARIDAYAATVIAEAQTALPDDT